MALDLVTRGLDVDPVVGVWGAGESHRRPHPLKFAPLHTLCECLATAILGFAASRVTHVLGHAGAFWLSVCFFGPHMLHVDSAVITKFNGLIIWQHQIEGVVYVFDL